MSSICLQDVVIGYAADVPISLPLCLSVEQGEVVAFIGKNGVGKSTLLKTIAGLVPPLRGKLSHTGQLEGGRLLSLVTTGRETPTLFTVEESISLGRFPYTNGWGTLRQEDWKIIDEIVSLLKLEKLRGRKLTELSDGERQRVAIARALVQQAPFLLLDEPSSYLDYPSRIALFQLLQELAHERNIGILFSTHEVELCQRFCDRIWCYYPDGSVISFLPKELNERVMNEIFDTQLFRM